MAVQNQITNKKPSFSLYMTNDAVKEQVANVVGKNSERFITSIISAVTVNPALQGCTSPSILSAALLGESLKLSPSPQLGYFYMIPYKDSKTGTTQAQFQIGYRGLWELAQRSGQYKKINVVPIKAGELKGYDPLNEEIVVELISDWDEREAAETCGYYAFFELANGFRKAIYWSKKQMVAHAEKYSPGFRAHKGYTFWEKNFDMMARKTMLKQLLKWGPSSIELQNAIVYDNTTGSTVDARSYAPDSFEMEEIEETIIEPEKPAETAHTPSQNMEDFFR